MSDESLNQSRLYISNSIYTSTKQHTVMSWGRLARNTSCHAVGPQTHGHKSLCICVPTLLLMLLCSILFLHCFHMNLG